MAKTGRCLCGGVSWAHEGPENWRGHCHCATCGTPVAYENARYPREIHLYAASLDDPMDFAPQFNVHDAERLPWIRLDDELPRFPHNGG